MYKVTVIGSPGTGKSSVIKLLRKKHNRNFTIAFLDEVATKVLEQVPHFRNLSPALFQAAITSTQIQAEEAVCDSFDQNGVEEAILITDRGTYDFYCYMTPEQAEALQCRFMFPRYNLVIYLEPGPYVGTKGNRLRNESEEEVEKLSQKTLEVWKSNHEDFVTIPYCENLEKKAQLVADEINKFFNKKIFI